MIRKYRKEQNIGEKSISASRKWLNGEGDTHWHDFYEIEYVIRGSGICNLNGREFPFSDGMLFFMTPADFHCVKTGGAEIINLMFVADLATPDCLAPLTSRCTPKSLSVPEETRPFLMMLLEEIVANQDRLTYCSALIDSLLLKLSQSLPAVFESNWNSASQKMHFYILNHFRDKLSLEDVAGYAGLTPAYASAVFKKEMQMGFKAYLNELRFDYAGKLLLHSDMTVAQICRESGFEDYPNFIRRFKQHFGLTPTQLRERKT